MRVLVLGVTGIFGHALFKELVGADHDVWGTIRHPGDRGFFSESEQTRLTWGVDARQLDTVVNVMARVRPDVVVNAIGLIKQVASAMDPLLALPINAEFPHRLSGLCALGGARLIHISTDCVFSGRRGGYRETDPSDAEDLYGKSKFIGEVSNASHAVTLRTSHIGHELHSNRSLLDWFLSQRGEVRGFGKAIFSGLPAVELARVIRTEVLPRPQLAGVYHVAGRPISKLALLQIIAAVYRKDINIVSDDSVVVDRSLDSSQFTAATGYRAADWPELIAFMHRRRPTAA